MVLYHRAVVVPNAIGVQGAPKTLTVWTICSLPKVQRCREQERSITLGGEVAVNKWLQLTSLAVQPLHSIAAARMHSHYMPFGVKSGLV